MAKLVERTCTVKRTLDEVLVNMYYMGHRGPRIDYANGCIRETLSRAQVEIHF